MKVVGMCLLVLWIGLVGFIPELSVVDAHAVVHAAVNSPKLNKEKTAQDWFNEGVDYQSRYLYNKAIQSYTEAIKLDGQVADVYYNRGCAYAEIHSYDDALFDFNKVIELMPADAEAYYNRGVVYDAKELYEQSLNDYDKAISLNEKYADAYYNKAVALENLGRSAESIPAYEAFIQYAPADDRDMFFAKERLQILSQ